MSRKIRIDYKGAYHHIVCRGNNGNFIFGSDDDKIAYLNCLTRYLEPYQVVLLAYCIMDNHVHMLIQSHDQHISLFMHDVQQAFSKWRHKTYQTYGLNYDGRYKNSHCDTMSYFRNILRYIHNNPIEAGITTTQDYAWSSYSEYLHGVGLINVEKAYALLGESKREAISQFLDIVRTDEDYDMYRALIEVKGLPDIDSTILIDYFLKLLDYPRHRLVGKLKDDYYIQLRNKVIYNLKQYLSIPNKELSEYFELSTSSIHRIMPRH